MELRSLSNNVRTTYVESLRYQPIEYNDSCRYIVLFTVFYMIGARFHFHIHSIQNSVLE